ncbi:hypothetical protein CEUSTIGMA_g7150.t1 [Chlamydomonas eustigma]|uniref:S-adenosyl-L-methionine-dependent methyltransferase n=1 Tax=Chlamydomonas eustigma TaxID=1157962 RepID=A0A250X9Y7_9CHLO|nr:hypothetical protein CEUSTIGMA_g7150.t1 [Chlamydomonas eustigma]|eukprot:GAX79709.1 hypothetical protein CEUSTIGMA_g7150.t1 [Chlamydomonas eustigma]
MSSKRDTKAAHEDVDLNQYSSRWEAMWSQGIVKGQAFDAGASSPALKNLLSSGKMHLKGLSTLVPGCGRGYDLVTFAAAGAASADGLELSASAVDNAQSYLNEIEAPELTAACHLHVGDFYKWQPESGPYDVGYDYTFCCAMHPSQREDWAVTWSRLIKPGGTLITLIFPVDSSRDPDVGPPFPLTPELYHKLLPAAGFECVSVEPVPPELSHNGREGKEYLGLWRRSA